MISTKKNLKNVKDFTNLTKSELSYSKKYKDFIKVKVVEKNIITKKREIIFTEKSNLSVINFDFKLKIPKQQNKTRFKFMAKFPKIKLIGKRPNTKFVTENKFIL